VAADVKYPYQNAYNPVSDGGPAPEAPSAAEVTRPIDVETLRQALAELEDAKQRLRRDNERELERLRARALDALLPVLDNLERSISAAESSRNVQALLDGMKLVHGQFLAALAPFGLERVSAVGSRFDPAVHDAVAIIPVADPLQDGVVVAEVEPAYRVGGRIVRPAKVQVGRAGGGFVRN
jgi:molecular chaperone GrpE (heat shock protein)